MAWLPGLLALFLWALLLSGCRPQESGQYTVTLQQAGTFVVDTEKGEITHRDQVYHYEISGGTTTIRYPNGAEYWQTWQGNSGYGGYSDDYDPDAYVDGGILLDVLSNRRPASSGRPNLPLILLFLPLGLWNLISPRSSWYLSHGWKYKDAEPSDMALGITRFGGRVMVLLAILSMFAA